MGRLLIACAAAALLGGCSGPGIGADPWAYDQALVHSYCIYGAVSSAQLVGCERHVRPRQIRRLDTNAARYARGQLDRCLRDAGPFCVGPHQQRSHPYRYGPTCSNGDPDYGKQYGGDSSC